LRCADHGDVCGTIFKPEAQSVFLDRYPHSEGELKEILMKSTRSAPHVPLGQACSKSVERWAIEPWQRVDLQLVERIAGLSNVFLHIDSPRSCASHGV
jgi:hypothetical protein